MADFLVNLKDFTMTKAQHRLLSEMAAGGRLVRLPSGRIRLYQRGQGQGINRLAARIFEEGWVEAKPLKQGGEEYFLTKQGEDALRQAQALANQMGRRKQRIQQRRELYA